MPQSRISFKELPFRARQLSGSELSKVFGGGCSTSGFCHQDKDCCANYVCSVQATCESVPTAGSGRRG